MDSGGLSSHFPSWCSSTSLPASSGIRSRCPRRSPPCSPARSRRHPRHDRPDSVNWSPVNSALEADLRRLVQGDVYCDDLHRTLYSTDASIFQIMPRAVVVPKDREDVVAVVKLAAERGIPVTARGAGSGLAGQTLGEGIILDFSKYMDRVLELSQAQGWVRVQPGVVLGKLNKYLKQFGLWFPPDPSSGDVATIGGMIANNAAGPRTVKYGPTRDYVLGLECVMDDGSGTGGARWRGLEAEMKALLDANRALIEQSRPQTLKNSSGYHVFDPQFDLTRLLVGSEGTLAI